MKNCSRSLSAMALLLSAGVAQGTMRIDRLRCESLQNPRGIDAPKPRLSWVLESNERNQSPVAYQILVASSPAALSRGEGDLWDSGKVASGDSLAEYLGKPLRSGAVCYWKVRVWDAVGKPGPYSVSASWTMGLLNRSDWKAEWITSPLLADPANRPRTPIRCYRGELSSSPDTPRWISLDLGTARSFDRIVLTPARPDSINHDTATVGFPKRFRLIASDHPDFQNPKVLFDQTGSDYPEPRSNACEFRFAATSARYVRLEVSRLAPWDAHDYVLFLAQFSLFSDVDNVSIGAGVTVSDSVESDQWSKRYLVDGKPNVEYAPFPAALDPKVPGVFSSSRTTSLRRDFTLDAPVRRATLYGTARGFYEARINGKRVGDSLLAPGFTDFHRRQNYESHDVTALLQKGPNTLAALLGYGWYAGHMNLFGNAYFYGYFPQFAAQLEIELTDGRRVLIRTDKQWQTTLDGSVLWSDLLEGEAVDFRKELPGWDKPGFDVSGWQAAWSQPLGSEEFSAQRLPPVKVIGEMKPVSQKEVRPGVWVYDMGQEITGWVRVKVAGPAGTHIVLRHAEAVKPDGEIDTASLWGTPQRDDYFLDGKGPCTLEPRFTYHGFRYFEVSGLASPPTEDTVVAINLHNTLEETGDFECSNPMFNRLMTASKWTQRNLMFDVPAGCAARSERLAWTGDIRPCVQTALFNFDSSTFLEKFSADMRDDQKPDGRYTDIAPHAHLAGTEICVGSPGWADAGVSLPWEVYVNTGDRRILADHYESAKRWVDFVHSQNPELLWTNARGMDWGDWLSAGLATPKELGSTAFFAHSTNLLSRMARVLGKDEDGARYEALFRGIKAAFIARYVSPEGSIASPTVPRNADVKTAVQGQMKDGRLELTVNNASLGTDPAPNVLKHLLLTIRFEGRQEVREYAEDRQIDLGGPGKNLEIIEARYGTFENQEEDAQGSYALALQFGLLDEPVRSKAIQKLVAAIKRDGDHPATGFWSSLEMIQALSGAGQHEKASQIVNLNTYPSLGYMLEAGGTTFWESFDADRRTLSLNHWTHSACGEWLWQNVAGLRPDPDQPGYRGFTVHPRPTSEVSWSKAKYRSVRGPIVIDWRVEKDRFSMELTVPPGSVAQVHIPGTAASVREGGRPIGTEGIRFLRMEEGSPVYSVPSGTYRFTATR
ncbi:hypothetical protein EON81_00920 [bacterium]|nr:MAG: hypothetical protein EON81_00920 [bacterium]